MFEGKSMLNLIDDDEDETMESFPIVIWNRLNVWSDKYHFPFVTLLPYIIGAAIFSFARNNQFPIWVDAIFIFLELVLMRISYDCIEDTHIAISWIITGDLYITSMPFLLGPLMAKLFPNTTRVTFESWLFRGTVIVASIILILRAAWKRRKRRRAWRKEIG